MPLPDGLARFNRRVTNRITEPFTRWLPGFGVVVHRGRRSGTEYRTPVNAFRTADGVAIALTYGAERDWVRNVLAAGGCDVLRRGGRGSYVDPQVRRGGLALVPAPVRLVLRALEVTDVLELRHRERTAAVDRGAGREGG